MHLHIFLKFDLCNVSSYIKQTLRNKSHQDVMIYTRSPHRHWVGTPDSNEEIMSLGKSYFYSTNEELAQENDAGKAKAQNEPSKSSLSLRQSQEHRLGKKTQIYTRRSPSKLNFHLCY